MTRIYVFSILLCFSLACSAQQEIYLYPGKIPGSIATPDEEEKKSDSDGGNLLFKVSRPTLTVYLPSKDKATGAAVIICPGGGYHVLVSTREGSRVARAFNEQGVAAFVLKYRLPDDKIMTDKSIGPLQDAQQAIKTVRERSGEWKIDPEKIGIMGFSAGGHLAATAGTHFRSPTIDNENGTSLRPDFMILVYPVISFMDGIGHVGSREFLLGKTPTDEKIKFFSNEYQVCKETPPAFITLAGDDTVVPITNSFIFYDTLKKNSVPAEMHVYSSGEHGFLKKPSFEEWFGRCCYWMKSNGWMK
ncbi:MAG: alpha/beta hydrolase [Bacteroidales bacterium]|nr:alpha/beta hydrolase [Bacteroidales bacterium]